MPDCSATIIRIGGRLTPENIEELAEAIEFEGVLAEDGSGVLDCDEAEALIRKTAAEGRCLSLHHGEKPWGQFKEIEEACHELGLTYYRADSGHYAYGASAVFWKPGMDEPQEWSGTPDLEPTLSLSTLQHLVRTNLLQAEIALMEEADRFPFAIEIMPADKPAAA